MKLMKLQKLPNEYPGNSYVQRLKNKRKKEKRRQLLELGEEPDSPLSPFTRYVYDPNVYKPDLKATGGANSTIKKLLNKCEDQIIKMEK